jgi:hypothetical protein
MFNFKSNFFSNFRSIDFQLVFLVILIFLISLLTLQSLDFGNKNLVLKHSIRFAFSFFVFLIVM